MKQEAANLEPVFARGKDTQTITIQCRRDIEEGEELFIDYTAVLQNAWSTVPWLW
jgi:SET domain-containing protein